MSGGGIAALDIAAPGVAFPVSTRSAQGILFRCGGLVWFLRAEAFRITLPAAHL
jgi:hypothetical protein